MRSPTTPYYSQRQVHLDTLSNKPGTAAGGPPITAYYSLSPTKDAEAASNDGLDKPRSRTSDPRGIKFLPSFLTPPTTSHPIPTTAAATTVATVTSVPTASATTTTTAITTSQSTAERPAYQNIIIRPPNMTVPRKAKRKRITPEQLEQLLAIFKETDTPSHEIREELSKKLNMTNREIQVWFQNRRAKVNRERQEEQRKLKNNDTLPYGQNRQQQPPPQDIRLRLRSDPMLVPGSSVPSAGLPALALPRSDIVYHQDTAVGPDPYSVPPGYYPEHRNSYPPAYAPHSHHHHHYYFRHASPRTASSVPPTTGASGSGGEVAYGEYTNTTGNNQYVTYHQGHPQSAYRPHLPQSATPHHQPHRRSSFEEYSAAPYPQQHPSSPNSVSHLPPSSLSPQRARATFGASISNESSDSSSNSLSLKSLSVKASHHIHTSRTEAVMIPHGYHHHHQQQQQQQRHPISTGDIYAQTSECPAGVNNYSTQLRHHPYKRAQQLSHGQHYRYSPPTRIIDGQYQRQHHHLYGSSRYAQYRDDPLTTEGTVPTSISATTPRPGQEVESVATSALGHHSPGSHKSLVEADSVDSHVGGGRPRRNTTGTLDCQGYPPYMLVARDHESDNSTATKHHIRSAGVTAVPSEDRQQQRVTHPSGGVMASIQQGAGVIAPSKDRDGRYDRRFPHQYEAAESKAQEETVMVVENPALPRLPPIGDITDPTASARHSRQAYNGSSGRARSNTTPSLPPARSLIESAGKHRPGADLPLKYSLEHQPKQQRQHSIAGIDALVEAAASRSTLEAGEGNIPNKPTAVAPFPQVEYRHHRPW